MGQIQALFEKIIQERFDARAIAFRHLSDAIKARGIRLTPSRWQDLRTIFDGAIGSGRISFEFTDDEMKTATLAQNELSDGKVNLKLGSKAILEGIQQAMSQAASKVVEEFSGVVLESVKRRKKDLLTDRRRDRARFAEVLAKKWGKALDLFDLLNGLAFEIGEGVNRQIQEGPDSKRDALAFVLIRLHARACQIASEISTLLWAGYADGAHARWRTLHELVVVALFVKRHGSEVAERYLRHDSIESYKASILHQSKAARLNIEPLKAEELQGIVATRHRLVDQYGKEFAEEYGWASKAIRKARPSFADIEGAVGMDHLRPYYKLASHNVHANSKGITFRMGLLTEGVLLAGPSDSGLMDPAQCAALSLTQITTTLVSLAPDLDRAVACKVMVNLQEELVRELSESHDKQVLAVRAAG